MKKTVEATCPQCEGTGMLEYAANEGCSWATDPGYEEYKCDICYGSGKVEDEQEVECDFCNDTGVVTKTYEWRGVRGDADDQECPNCKESK